MVPQTLATLLSVACSISTVRALTATDADTMYNAYNARFLTQNGSTAYYQASLDDSSPDKNWPQDFDIFVPLDVYQRRGDAATKALITDLANTWLEQTPPGSVSTPWSWDGWNDDIGWYVSMLVRAYGATQQANYLSVAEDGFNYAFNRGWNTTYNDGGIWEQQPDETPAGQPINKQPLSNDSLGRTAARIYKWTKDQDYLNKAEQIYGWMRTHLFNTTNGQVLCWINESSIVDYSKEVYNQGTFIDYANELWKITGNKTYYNDALLALQYGEIITDNGIFSNTAGYLNSWADEYARGGGNFISDNNLWSTYYPFWLNNANAILQNRRTDLGITWNGWNQMTPQDDTLITNKFVSAVAWLQYTPATDPSNTTEGRIMGLKTMKNKASGMAVTVTGSSLTQTPRPSDGNEGQEQRWEFSHNSEDNTWNIVNLGSFEALQADFDGTMSLATFTRDDSQRWFIHDQEKISGFKIVNKKTGDSLDGTSATTDDPGVIARSFDGTARQTWFLDSLQI